MSGGRLVVLDRLGRDVKRYSLPSGLVTLGSDPDCDIRVMLPTVSRHHATVVVRAHQTVIRNISDGRTLVNGQPVSVSGLQHGDTITLGDRSLRWEYDQPSAVKAVANQALYVKKGKAKTARGRGRASEAAARRVDPSVQLVLEMNHRASMPGRQVAIVQPQRRENDAAESSPRLIVKPHRPYSQAAKRQRPSKPDSPLPEADTRRKSAARVSPKADLTTTTKATLWIESRKSTPRKLATAVTPAPPLRTIVLRKAATPSLKLAARSPRKTPAAKVAKTPAAKVAKTPAAKVAKIQAPLELDPTKQAALMLMTGRTPKSKPPSLSPGTSPSYLVKRPSPVRKTPQSTKKTPQSSKKTPANRTPKKSPSPANAKVPKRQSRRSVRTRDAKSDDETPRRSSGYEPHKSTRSSRGSAGKSVSILEISDTDRHRSQRSVSASGLRTPVSPTLPSPRKSALKDPMAKNTSRKNESIKFDLSNLENSNDQSEVMILSHTTRSQSFSDGTVSEEDLTLQYSDSMLPISPSPRRSIHSRSSRIHEKSLGTPVEGKNYMRTLTPQSPSARQSVRGSLLVQKVLGSSTNESAHSRRATKSMDPGTTSLSRSPRSKLEVYSIVDLVSINDSDSRSSEYNSARSTRTTFATPENRGRKTRSTIDPSLLLGSSTPFVQSSPNKNHSSGRNSAHSKRSLSLSTPKATKVSVPSKRSSSLSTPENTKPPVSINSTRASRKSRRTVNDSDLLIISGHEDSPKTSKRNSRSSHRSIDMTRNTSKSSLNTTRQSSKSPNVSSQTSTSPNSTRKSLKSPNVSRQSSKSANTTRKSTRSNADSSRLSSKSSNTSRLSPKFPNASTLSPKSPTASRLSRKSQNASRLNQKSPNASKLSLKFAKTARQSTLSDSNASKSSPKSPNVSVLSPKSPNSSRKSLKSSNTTQQTYKSPNNSKLSSTSNTSRKSSRNLTLTIGPAGDGLHTPENRHSPEEISTPVLSIQSLLDSSASSLFSQVSTKRGRLSIKPNRKTIGGLRSQPKRGRPSSKSKSFHLGTTRKSLLRHSKDSSEISDKTDDGAPKPSNEENITPKSTVKLIQEAVKNKHSTAKKPQSKRSIIDNLNESDLKDLFNSPVKRKLSQSMTEFSRTQLFDDEPAPKKKTRNTIALTGRSLDQSLPDRSENITAELFVSPLTTPGNSPKVSGIKKLFRKNTPQNDLTDVRGVKELLRGRKSLRTSVGGVKNLFAKSPNNNLTNVRGVKELFRSSPRNDLRRVTGVTSLFRTKGKGKSPKNDLTHVQGVKKLFQKTSPKNDLRNVSGVKKGLTLRSPKNDLTDVRGVKQLFRGEKSRSGLNDLSGVEELFNTSANYERNSLHDGSMSEFLFDEAFGRPKVKATYARSFTAKSVQRQKNQRSNKSLNVSFDLLTKGASWLEKESKKPKKTASPKTQNKSLNKSKNRELQMLSTDTVEGADPLQKSRTRVSTLITSIPDVIQPKKSSSFNEKSLPIKKRSFVENSLEKSSNSSKINLPIKKRALVHSTPVKGRWNMTANASELGRVSPIAADKTSIDSDVTIRIGSVQVSPNPSRATKSIAKAGTPHSPPKKRSTRASRVQKTPAKSPKAARGRKTSGAPEVTNTKRVRGSLAITLKSPKANPVATSSKATANSEITRSSKSPRALAKKAPKAPKAVPASPKTVAKSPKASAKSPKAAAKSPKASAKSPKAAAKSPKASAKSPKAAAKSPKAVAKSPKAVTKSPKAVAKSPKPTRAKRGQKASPTSPKADIKSPKAAARSPKPARVTKKSAKSLKDTPKSPAKSPRAVAKKAPKAPKSAPSPKPSAKSPKPQRGAPKSSPVSPKPAPKSARSTRAGPKSPKPASPKPPTPKQTRKTRKTTEASPKTSPKKPRTTRNRVADVKPVTPKTKRGKVSKNATLIIAKPSPQLKPQKKVNFSIEIEPKGRRGRKTAEKSSPVENEPKRGRTKVESPAERSGNKVQSPRPVKRGRKQQETTPKESPVKPKRGRNTTETSINTTEPKGRKRRGAALDVEIPAKTSRRGKAVDTTKKSPAESPKTGASTSKAQKTKKTEAAEKTEKQKEAEAKTTRGRKNQSTAETTLKGRKRKSDEASMSSSRGSVKKVSRTTRKTGALASPAKASKAATTSTKATKAKASPAKTSKTKASPAKATKAKASPAKATKAKASPAKATKAKASPAKATKAKASPVKVARSTRRQANTSKASTSTSTRSRRK